MKISVKASPDDFFVQERISLKPTSKGAFGLYLLSKRNWNTVDAIRRISTDLDVPLQKFSYAGKKDRHAHTEQVITIEDTHVHVFQQEDISLKHLGFVHQPIQAKDIESNYFQLILRGIPVAFTEQIRNDLTLISKKGVVNYFDDQRFGGWDSHAGFLGEKIIKQHYMKAVFWLMTSRHPQDKREAKDRKDAFRENWGKWDKCLALAKTPFEQRTFEILKANKKPYLPILQSISHETLSMAFSAYQSYIWNEHVIMLLEKILEPQTKGYVKGVVNRFLFYKDLDRETMQYLSTLTIPTLGKSMPMPDHQNKNIAEKLFKKHELNMQMFKDIPFLSAFVKSYDRDVIIKPQEMKMEDHPEGLKVSFVLPRGAYATLIIKRIMAYV